MPGFAVCPWPGIRRPVTCREDGGGILTHMTQPTVALLGTGIMGAGMGRNIARAGLPLRVWNRTRAKAEPLTAEGAIVVETPADAVRGADIVVTMLSDGPAVLEAMMVASSGLTAGQVWAQASTVGPEALGSLSDFARSHDLVLIDSPVQGTRAPAESGNLLVYAAGPELPGPSRSEVRARVQPVYDAVGSRTVWMDRLGDASRFKLVTNAWVLAMTAAAGEVIAFAQRIGVDPQRFLDSIKGSATDSGYLQLKGSAILSGDFTPNFPLDMAEKDARLIIAAGEAAGTRMEVTHAASNLFQRAARAGHGRDDMAATYFASLDE
jgi:3-hydroxyisobutyrate dehydrogenase